MGYCCFDVEISDKVAHLRLNRPDELNTMVPAFWSELPQIVREIDDDGSARVIVLSSTGKHFSAGMDLSVFTGGAGLPGNEEPRTTEMGRTRARLRQTALLLQESFNALEKARQPVLAAVQGGCVGGAVDMVTACDCRYATADAFFVVQEINIGMTADVGTLQRLPKLIPEGVARELAYTGRRMPAARAKEVGLVNEVFDTQEAMLEAVMEIAREIAAKSPLAIWGTKEMVNYARDHSVADGLNYIATWQTGMFQPADMMESFAAKSEKRDPRFDDLLPNPKSF
ncbi:crotonase/enoyl-CoA hydratase family protein [Rhabdothermincola sediminis]|uniref:crotonase/enoyl-CoA hydratase family protein n=1 Tax=Rhabdothermincola sediminis TaxID=2751370 RepID=UPI001AA030BE|nr:crotonase/enoyl-CoA hydratase family protein [Rhabdothermincola sediminis]